MTPLAVHVLNATGPTSKKPARWRLASFVAGLSVAALALLALSGCGSGQSLQGEAPPSFDTHTVGTQAGCWVIACAASSSTQITPKIAVTAGHSAWEIAFTHTEHFKIADLAWFEHEGAAPKIRDPILGERVTLYGNSAGLGSRVAYGTVTYNHFGLCRERAPDLSDDHSQAKACRKLGMGVDYGLVVSAPAGEGFSGGGMYGDDGALLGVTVEIMPGGGMFGYWATEIRDEIQTTTAPKPASNAMPWWAIALLVIL